MYHLITSLLLALMLSVNTQAQSILISNPNPNDFNAYNIGFGSGLFTCDVANIGSDTIDVGVFRQFITQATGHENAFSWGNWSYPPFVDTSYVNEPVVMAPGHIESTFQGYVFMNGVQGVTKMRYCFFDQNNIADSSCIIVNYDLFTIGIDDKTESIVVSEPYPNPSSDQIQIAFNIDHVANQYTIDIFNALGELIQTDALKGTEGIYTLDTSSLPAGIYNLAIRSNGSSVSSKQFMVMR